MVKSLVAHTLMLVAKHCSTLMTGMGLAGKKQDLLGETVNEKWENNSRATDLMSSIQIYST
jgi:hypothetical protein